MGTVVTEPGVYDMDAADYLADPVPDGSLSSSGARMLLPPSCPALFRWAQDNPPETKTHFDVGHAAHKLVLGEGPDLVRVDVDERRGKAWTEPADEARAQGKTPLPRGDYATVHAMAAALHAHPVASALFDPERGGKAEQSLFWRDPEHGVWRRARLDWLPAATEAGRIIVPDYKTCRCAEPSALGKAMANYGYASQAAWYVDTVRALELADDVPFVFVFQEKTPPYLVTVAEPDATAIRVGRRKNHRALEVYAECAAANTWPGYTDDVELISLPPWADAAYRQEQYA